MQRQINEALSELWLRASPHSVGALQVAGAFRLLVDLNVVLGKAYGDPEFRREAEQVTYQAQKIIAALKERYDGEDWRRDVQPLAADICKNLTRNLCYALDIRPGDRKAWHMDHLAIVVLGEFGLLPSHLKEQRRSLWSYNGQQDQDEVTEAFEVVKGRGKEFLEATLRIGAGTLASDRYVKFKRQFELMDDLESLANVEREAASSPHILQLG